MKLAALETFVVGNPPPGFGGRYFVFVKLATACGIVGYGEIYTAAFSPFVVEQMALDLFARYLDGADPFRCEAFFRRAYGSGFSQRPDPSMAGVVSGLEMAMWDIVGKAVDKPVHALLGGRVHERLRSYTYLYPSQGEDPATFYHDADRAAETAERYVAQGFTAVKFDPAGPYSVYDGRQPDLDALERCDALCRKVREAVGTRADLLFGTHGQFTASGALRLARRLEAHDPLWLEEPVPPDAPEEMAKVARGTSIPVATGERLCTKWEFARVLTSGAASILQMNLGRVGGLLEAKKIAGMAEAFHAQIAPHLYCGPIVAAANIQLAACSPNFLILESIGTFDGFHTRLLKTPIVWENGYVVTPTAPGLGVELDEEVARAHPYEGEGLHLDMAQTPVDPTRDARFGVPRP
ncbi:mandelate racemase/muconate lactonizing enzyme family protein [Stappia stellulata]|uniref:mandelate racemase/muconate lactonizing enzyme family protein n=1 Tax=Stappia stellulata TaxID=71235 RepID=UPI001CD7A3A5|nr:mandelate racemase/muconate lactonizing enzyme family protein [Stappia stellulata]MCA1243848.1 mandelate racemase/muconate lactonizing enzyme family protein [Stappia stellulata]